MYESGQLDSSGLHYIGDVYWHKAAHMTYVHK